jgi:sulfur carrier protein ThiS adenylyltransferase
MAEVDIFARNVAGITAVLRESTVAVAGCGGLGSNIALALVRAGVGTLILADHDLVEASNLNRQQFYLSDIGQPKVEALAAHLREIVPEVSLQLHQTEVNPENVVTLFGTADLLIEAFDRAESKTMLTGSWCGAFPDKPLVCGNGVSGLGGSEKVKLVRAGNIYLCGDGESDMSQGLCSAKVAMVANMQANVAIELLVSGKVT